MIALYILLGLVAIVLLILFVPFRLNVIYENEPIVKLKWLFFSFKLSPIDDSRKKPKTEKLKRPKKPKQKKKNEESSDEEKESQSKVDKIINILKKKGLHNILDFVKDCVEIIFQLTVKICRHIKIKKFNLLVVLADNDYTKLGRTYGEVSAILANSAKILTSITKEKYVKFRIIPNYITQESSVYCDITLSVMLIFLLHNGLRALFKFIKIYRNIIKCDEN